MSKVLFAVLLALMMTLALVGVKRAFVNHTSSSSQTVVAEGGAPAPPIPW